MSDFYITLPSHSNTSEFPNNVSNAFKIRLPHPIRLEGSGWKVGMVSVSLPDSQVVVLVNADGSCSETNPDVLFKSKWIRIEVSKNNVGTANFDCLDLRRVFSNVDGIGFMKSMVTFFEHRRIYNDSGPKLGAKYTTNNGKRTYVKFVWQGDELVTDNKDILTTLDLVDRPSFKINVELAKKMGWLEYREEFKAYRLGPHIQQEFYQDSIPLLTNTNDVFNHQGDPAFWTVDSGFLQLSIFCDWRFLNLNKAFESVVGVSSRPLFIYSDVGSSGVVGNQVTDLLREVSYKRQGKGSQYFEPLHIQYIPVRKDTIDIIETQVAETSGRLTQFGTGNTIVTLHFKKT